jgi:phosphoribosylanthranilate isomerase
MESHTLRVKICGLTNLADAQAAIKAGADLLGFNFYKPSPRYIAPDAAAAIIASLRAEFGRTNGGLPFQCVGVFVNLPLAEARAIEAQCGLDLLQMSGDEEPDYMQAVGARAYKGLRPATPTAAQNDVARFGAIDGPPEPRFLIDASHPQLYGGTGKTGDWALACEVAGSYPILLAGGLNPANVADAIEAVQPWGVDVASGVERAPGLKDAVKVHDFIRVAKGTTNG